ncbi:MAG: carbohydrate ABC transporter permease [Firmicutes bacterium]|nr:carbohydrate ABC transporter permease [Bacillota bacterium]
MIVIPLFLNFRYFDFFGLLEGGGYNLIGTYWPFLLTALTGTGARNGLYIFIARQHFRGMPRALEESAYIDGASQFRTFWEIMLPGATPIMLVIFLFSFVWQWNDVFYTGIFMRGGMTLLPFSLRNLIGKYHWSISAEYKTIVNNTGMVLFLLPILLFYVFLQRYFVESVERTGIVG